MTDYKSMFEQAVRTLAAIDEALGIGDDGCGIGKLAGVVSSTGGTNIGAMLEGIMQSPAGSTLINSVVNKLRSSKE